MKKSIILVMLIAVAMFAACGGGGESSNCPAAKTAILESFNQFGALIEDPAIQFCVQQQQTNCNCPGGGTAVADIAQRKLTLTNCKDANGNTFNGTFTFDENMTTVSADVPTFGSCTNGSASDIKLTGCGGSISATCSSTGVNCNIIDDPNGQGGCTLECSC